MEHDRLIEGVLRDLRYRAPLPPPWPEAFRAEAREFVVAMARYADELELRLRAWAEPVWRDYGDELRRQDADHLEQEARATAAQREAEQQRAMRLADRTERLWQLPGMRPDIAELRTTIERREITRVYHWTEAKNLESILQHGLRPRRWLRERRVATSFHSYGSPAKARQLEDYVGVMLRSHEGMIQHAHDPIVLELEPAVIGVAGTLFVPGNSARADLDVTNRASLTTVEAFDALFDDKAGDWLVDWQSEIWIPGHISPLSIMAVGVRAAETYDRLIAAWPRQFATWPHAVELAFTGTWNVPSMIVSVDDIRV
ncbi:MAG: DUF4433 domain-containing protein [Chloroflexi bacterium]|nr:DUF4433 domain-containing protein [Chloroflexota bacterium]